MEQSSYNNHPRPVLTQAENNTTLWIGHLSTDPTDHFAGQTFRCPTEGLLDSIQIYSSFVTHPGELALSLHEFDHQTKSWGPSIGNTSISVEKDDESRWIRFNLQPVNLQKDRTYGFRIHTANAMVGLGEAASANQRPFPFGYEWSADSTDQSGQFFSYFSLAFKVMMCA